MDLAKVLQQIVKEGKDKRTWRDVMEEDKEMRNLLYSSRHLFLRSAKGASEGVTWIESLREMLRYKDWNKKEQGILTFLIAEILNGKEEEHEAIS